MTELFGAGGQPLDAKTDGPSELDMLKMRAKAMGLTFSGNIGLEALRAKVDAAIEGKRDDTDEQLNASANEPNPLNAAGDPVLPKEETVQQLRKRLHDEALRLVRVRIQNLDPKKKDLPGEILCVGNEIIGTVKKFIPFGEATDNGYHVPKILLDELKERRFLNIRTTRKAGQIQVHRTWAREFAIEELEPLTQDELARLAAQQSAAGAIDSMNTEA